jgi:hypothetical protein
VSGLYALLSLNNASKLADAGGLFVNAVPAASMAKLWVRFLVVSFVDEELFGEERRGSVWLGGTVGVGRFRLVGLLLVGAAAAVPQ